MKMLTIPALMAGALWLAGCADGNYRPYVLDDSFGKTSRQLVNASIADPQAAAHPPANSPRKMDGYAGVHIMRGYRQGFSQTPDQPPSVSINVGGNLSGGGSGGQ